MLLGVPVRVALTWHAVGPCCELGRGIPSAVGADKDSLLTSCDADGAMRKRGFYRSAAFASVSAFPCFLSVITFEIY